MAILPTVWTCQYPCPTGKVKFIVTCFVLIWLATKKGKKKVHLKTLLRLPLIQRKIAMG